VPTGESGDISAYILQLAEEQGTSLASSDRKRCLTPPIRGEIPLHSPFSECRHEICRSRVRYDGSETASSDDHCTVSPALSHSPSIVHSPGQCNVRDGDRARSAVSGGSQIGAAIPS
jgi:hypothetical protein